MSIKRVGGAVVAIIGLALLVGPLGLSVWGPHRHTDPKVLYDLAYITSLGLFLLIVGLYLFTRRAKKAPEDHDRR